MKLKLTCYLILLLAFNNVSLASHMSMGNLIESIKTHHPTILAAKEKRLQTEHLQQKAEGAFDLELTQTSQIRTTGFFNGWYVDQAISKPLEAYNAKVTARYRRSSGDFPIYENYFFTESGGEASVSLEFSLLKNSQIDKRRVALKNAQFHLDIGLSQEEITKNKLIYEGVNAYLDWYRAFKQTQVATELLNLASARQQGIESRIKNGDLAQISLTEFKTILLSRQATLLEAEQVLEQAKLELGFYWRDDEGNQRYIDNTQLPSKQLEWPFKSVVFNEQWREKIMARHPVLAKIAAKKSILTNDLKLAKNDLRPKLDIEVKVAEDFGRGGSVTLDGTESYVGINFSVPIERRKAKANISIAKSKLSELQYKQAAMLDKMTNDISIHINQLNVLQQLSDLRAEQAVVAKQLELQERNRFDAGDSDLFLLNTRESQAGKTKLKSIEAEVLWWQKKLDIIALSAQLAI